MEPPLSDLVFLQGMAYFFLSSLYRSYHAVFCTGTQWLILADNGKVLFFPFFFSSPFIYFFLDWHLHLFPLRAFLSGLSWHWLNSSYYLVQFYLPSLLILYNTLISFTRKELEVPCEPRVLAHGVGCAAVVRNCLLEGTSQHLTFQYCVFLFRTWLEYAAGDAA